MKVFVGWPYEATWVEEYAIPLIESYGVEVTTGKELQGQVITSGVKAKIEEADAVVCFTIRRGRGSRNNYKTSDWVVQEILHANSRNKENLRSMRPSCSATARRSTFDMG